MDGSPCALEIGLRPSADRPRRRWCTVCVPVYNALGAGSWTTWSAAECLFVTRPCRENRAHLWKTSPHPSGRRVVRSMARYEQILNDQKGRLGLHISSRCVCVWGSQTTTGFTCFRMQGVPGDCRRLAPTKTFLLSCEMDLGRQVDVPAACDIVYSTSCALFPYSYLRCALVFWLRFWRVKQVLRFKVCLGFASLLKTLRHIFLLMPQQSLKLIAEFISLMRTHHQGSLGVQV